MFAFWSSPQRSWSALFMLGFWGETEKLLLLVLFRGLGVLIFRNKMERRGRKSSFQHSIHLLNIGTAFCFEASSNVIWFI